MPSDFEKSVAFVLAVAELLNTDNLLHSELTLHSHIFYNEYKNLNNIEKHQHVFVSSITTYKKIEIIFIRRFPHE